ncbi:hypothetical protein DNH61_05660 [Paenibacillus sambharensis]|uniref:Phosphodiester glycosidase domain-containing protein n=1 Tax=Paenibacillus sambharensis TaxID=1803190 RepID=A0A2W1LYW9_9BACL|nr:hypothetical protein DNH61_05660 [Paenibacillus sambharensis]
MEAGEGINLHIIKTKPDRLRLTVIGGNVTASGRPGINGGFFWEEQLLSIAVENDKPVNGKPKGYGSGWFTAKYPRGTFVYDDAANSMSVQVVSSAEELQVSDRSDYWAQGGISMNLQHDDIWKQAAEEEKLPFGGDKRLRTGMVYDLEGNVHLIVSSVKCTAEQFRSAIMELKEPNSLVEGIFLDGDGSSQLLLENVKLTGDGRAVLQMIEIE